ncbi:hypothetical protein PG994_014129 [Apiospora phragmitis]|uniref:FAD-binding PCMH-type domain-containing protein n=1 Tax=Apiospora phragmitis TaxID=2905665 RepID=A0ABR1T3V9_9PEZI
MTCLATLRRAVVLCCALLQHSVALTAAANNTETCKCKCIPGDACWPSAQDWTEFNATIGGKLVTPFQLAAVCHNPGYDEAACEVIQREWTSPWLQFGTLSFLSFPSLLFLHSPFPTLVLHLVYSTCCFGPLFGDILLTGGTVQRRILLFAHGSSQLPCELGNTITYSVNATDASDFSKAVQFARRRNIRLVIRNTGHDYLGKSTGKWALSVWTHHMKKVEYIQQHNSDLYHGPAVRLGAGVQVEEAYQAARAYNGVVVGGDCATVGVVGGYLQGGGHSALSSLYGMAADQVLEWEVVDGTGNILQATPSSNADLYWALSGGGGGTYGIVSSVVVKLLPDVPVAGVQLKFRAESRAKLEGFHRAVRTYHQLVPAITAAKGMGIAQVTNDTFLLTPLTLPASSSDSPRALLAPLIGELGKQGIAYSLNITEHPNWLQYWRQLIKPNPTQLVQNAQYGGWFLPKEVVAKQADALQWAIREVTDVGCVFVGLAINVSRISTTPQNSILPSWREAALSVILSTSWPERADLHTMEKMAHIMTDVCVPALARLAPDAGAYLNEPGRLVPRIQADPNQPDWQKAFYGENYNRLLAIKNRYDPDHLFYAPTAVGSERYSGRPSRTTVPESMMERRREGGEGTASEGADERQADRLVRFGTG